MEKLPQEIINLTDHPDKDLVKSIHDFVFLQLRDWMYNPDNLRYNLPLFGTFYFKKAKTQLYIDKNMHTKKTMKSGVPIEKLEQKLDVLKLIIKEYEDYSEKRKQYMYDKWGKENYESYKVALKKKREEIRQRNISRERS